MNTPKRSGRQWIALLIIAAIAALGVIVWRSTVGVRGAAVETLLPELIKSMQGDQRRLASAILTSCWEYRANAQRWSLGYHGTTILSAVLSAAAGVVLKLELWPKSESLKKDLAAACAASAALLITITTTVGFERKWQANRAAAAELRVVRVGAYGQDVQSQLDHPLNPSIPFPPSRGEGDASTRHPCFQKL